MMIFYYIILTTDNETIRASFIELCICIMITFDNKTVVLVDYYVAILLFILFTVIYMLHVYVFLVVYALSRQFRDEYESTNKIELKNSVDLDQKLANRFN